MNRGGTAENVFFQITNSGENEILAIRGYFKVDEIIGVMF